MADTVKYAPSVMAEGAEPAPVSPVTTATKKAAKQPLALGVDAFANVKQPLMPGAHNFATVPKTLGFPQAPTARPATQPLTPIPATSSAPVVPATPDAGPVTTTAPMAPMPAGAFPQTDPTNPLTQQTIQRTPEQDRFAIAQDRFNTFAQASDPAYQSALRQANRMGAAQGRLGSGSLRTDFGNLANQRGLQLQTAQDQFLQNALEGTMEDQFRDLGIAQQQQGFQQGQQQLAFENELRRLGFSDEMLNSAFGRALQTYMAGQAGGTGSQTGIAVGQNIGGQGQDALSALNDLIRGRAATPQAPSTPPIAGGQTFPWLGGSPT